MWIACIHTNTHYVCLMCTHMHKFIHTYKHTYMHTRMHAWQGWSWFSYHPLAMCIAYIGIAGNAVLLKKVPCIHVCMCVCVCMHLWNVDWKYVEILFCFTRYLAFMCVCMYEWMHVFVYLIEIPFCFWCSCMYVCMYAYSWKFFSCPEIDYVYACMFMCACVYASMYACMYVCTWK